MAAQEGALARRNHDDGLVVVEEAVYTLAMPWASVGWTDIVQATATAVTALGLLIGGVWAFFRFRTSRSFMPRCSIQLDCAVTGVDTTQVLRVDAVITNCGFALVTFNPTDRARVEVSPVHAVNDRHGGILWPKAEWPLIEDLLAVEGSRLNPIELEPGQDIRRSVLFVLPASWTAVRVACSISHGAGASQREWASTRVAVRGVEVERAGVFNTAKKTKKGGKDS